MVLRRIVTRSEVNGSIQLRALNFVGNRGGRRKRFAEQRSNSVLPQNGHGQRRKFLRIKAGIITNQNSRLAAFRLRVFRNRSDGKPHVGKRKIVGDQSSPS